MMASMKTKDESPSVEASEYGYGLQISLSDDQMEALGIKEPIEAGEVVTIHAKAFVKRATQSVEGDDKEADLTMSLQITDMELIHDDGRSQAQKMYSKSDMKE